MKKRIFLLWCLISCITAIGRSASVSSKDLLGIAPEDEQLYKVLSADGRIKCKDGSLKFTKSRLNDNFCDCPDGTDEPGTSACPNGKFYCRNAGHTPFILYSSRVNDGICDCCDGSDEYDGRIQCSNTCWQAGKVARDKLQIKIETFQEGVSIRRREIEQAKLAVAKVVVELGKLKSEEKLLTGLVEQLKERKEKIEKAEETERLQKEKEEKEKKEAEEAITREIEVEGKADIVGEPIKRSKDEQMDVVEDQEDSVGEIEHIDNLCSEGSPDNAVEQKEEEAVAADRTGIDTGSEGDDTSENIEPLSREELGRRVASRWTGEKTVQQTEEVDAAQNDDHENNEETAKDSHFEEHNSYDSETEDEPEDQMEDFGEQDHDYSSSSYKSESDDESDFSVTGSDTTSTSNPSWLEKIQQTVHDILQAVNLFRTPVNISEAANVRKEYDRSSTKLSKLQSRISSLTQKLKYDFGPEKEFYSFYGQCFESKQNKYVYKICPFKQATQEEGYSTTNLGKWDKFEDSYRIMQFSNGDKCWNGPDRSLKVKLRCGLKNEVTDIDEPSRCEYLALLSTPALCLEEKLKELQDKLNLLIKEQPKGHDEL